MARGPFPTGEDLRRNVSDPIYQANHSADVPAWAAAGVADAAQGFGRRLRKMADEAYTREGQADAAADINGADPLALRPGRGVDDEAYNAVLREQMLAQRQTAYLDGLNAVETANPDNLGAFATAAAANRAAFNEKPIEDPQLAASMASFITLQDGAALRRVRAGEEKRRVETAVGAFVASASTGRTAIGQATASAGFDDAGAALVGASLTQYASTLSRYGPREAFVLGGVEFPADPTRAAAVSPQVLETAFNEAQAETRMSWIANAGVNAPDLASKRRFLATVRERWAAGDPAFIGLDAPDMDRLTARLEADADRTETDLRAQIAGAAADARDMLTALEYGADVDMEELRRLGRVSGDPGIQAQIEYRAAYGFKVSPREGGNGAGGLGAGFDGWVGFLLDRLEGPGLVGNDNGRGRAQYGITEASHPEAWRDGRIDRTEAAAIYRRDYWTPIGGDQLDPELAFVAAASAVIGGVGTAKDLLAQADGDPERFLRLEEARFRRLAAEDPAKYGDDLPGWLERQGRIRGQLSAMRAERRNQDGYVSDPIGHARGSRTRPALATVPEFDPRGVFTGGEAGAQWSAALRRRRQLGEGLAQRDGVPARIFDNAEVSYYKDALAEDPGLIVPFAAGLATALGGDGARDAFQELGRAGMAGPDLHLAWLATEATSANIVRKAVEGRVLRAGGAKEADFGEDETIAAVVQATAPALAAQPDLLTAVGSVARDMAIADAARGQLRPAGDYVNSALGATNRNGVRYGGVTRVNGTATVAPTWLRADALDEALEIAAEGWVSADRGPVYSNGEAIPARELARYRLRALPNGRYGLVHPRTGAAVAARNGSTFEFDAERDAFRDLLSRRLPGAVLGRP